jgi:hypothetical protein
MAFETTNSTYIEATKKTKREGKNVVRFVFRVLFSFLATHFDTIYARYTMDENVSSPSHTPLLMFRGEKEEKKSLDKAAC